MVFGNSKWWPLLSWDPSCATDTLWGSTSITLWGGILNEVFGTYGEVGMGSYQVGNIPRGGLREEATDCCELDCIGEKGSAHSCAVWGNRKRE